MKTMSSQILGQHRRIITHKSQCLNQRCAWHRECLDLDRRLGLSRWDRRFCETYSLRRKCGGICKAKSLCLDRQNRGLRDLQGRRRRCLEVMGKEVSRSQTWMCCTGPDESPYRHCVLQTISLPIGLLTAVSVWISVTGGGVTEM